MNVVVGCLIVIFCSVVLAYFIGNAFTTIYNVNTERFSLTRQVIGKIAIGFQYIIGVASVIACVLGIIFGIEIIFGG